MTDCGQQPQDCRRGNHVLHVQQRTLEHLNLPCGSLMHESMALTCGRRPTISAEKRLSTSHSRRHEAADHAAASQHHRQSTYTTHRIDHGGLLPVVLPVEFVAVLAGEGAPEPLRRTWVSATACAAVPDTMRCAFRRQSEGITRRCCHVKYSPRGRRPPGRYWRPH